MMVGIVSGTYSTIFIAAAIAIILSQQREQARVPATAASEAAAGGARKSRTERTARPRRGAKAGGYAQAVVLGIVQG